jgi:hypothetical protein
MGYLINSGSGFLSDAVQLVSNKKSYLLNTTGYGAVDNIRIGYQDFGTRVLNDGATIESYECANDAILATPTANIGRQLFDAYDARVALASGNTEARDCTINELYELKQE